MKNNKLSCCLSVMLLFTGMAVSQAQVNKEYLITKTSFGKINKKTTYADLLKIYGEDNLKEDFYFAEGDADDTIKLTLVYPETDKEIAVYWGSEFFHKKINSIATSRQYSPYYTIGGLKVSNDLKKLLKANKKRIDFLGFGWDYGGAVVSFNEGKLDKSPIQFLLEGGQNLSANLDGDEQFNTDMELVKGNLDKIFIAKISLSFAEDEDNEK